MKIVKNIKNMISPAAKAEIQALENWKEEYIRQIEGLENAGMNENFQSKWQAYKDFQPGEAWQKFEQKISVTTQYRRKGRSAILYYLSGAAVMVIVFGAWWLMRSTSTVHLPVRFEADHQAIQLKLEDKSEIVLDSFSNLEQIAYRQVVLSGRAFFSVAKDSSTPFIIQTPEASVKVLGTAFHVITKNGKTRVDVTEGLVEISRDNQSVRCSAGQTAEVYNGRVYKLEKPDNITADWKSNILVFDNVQIEEVLKTIALHYQVDLRFENPISGKDCLIKTKFVNTGLPDVLKEIGMIARLEYTLQNNVLTVTRLGC